jgi:YHS domain-containing protein
MTRDPICFADINESDARRASLFSEYNGRTFFFCSRACKDRFDRDPGAFMHAPPWEKEGDRPEIYIG